jgi:hypothetical protein
LLCDKWGKTRFLFSNGFIREHKAPLQKHFGEISQAQLIPKPPQDNQQDHIGGIFQVVERCSCSFVEEVLASGAAEQTITEHGLLGLLFGGG